MAALRELFTTDVGLLSLFVLGFVVAMAFWFGRYFLARMREDELAARSAAAARPDRPAR